jgi:hypothetical protein
MSKFGAQECHKTVAKIETWVTERSVGGLWLVGKSPDDSCIASELACILNEPLSADLHSSKYITPHSPLSVSVIVYGNAIQTIRP